MVKAEEQGEKKALKKLVDQLDDGSGSSASITSTASSGNSNAVKNLAVKSNKTDKDVKGIKREVEHMIRENEKNEIKREVEMVKVKEEMKQEARTEAKRIGKHNVQRDANK